MSFLRNKGFFLIPVWYNRFIKWKQPLIKTLNRKFIMKVSYESNKTHEATSPIIVIKFTQKEQTKEFHAELQETIINRLSSWNWEMVHYDDESIQMASPDDRIIDMVMDYRELLKELPAIKAELAGKIIPQEKDQDEELLEQERQAAISKAKAEYEAEEAKRIKRERANELARIRYAKAKAAKAAK